MYLKIIHNEFMAKITAIASDSIARGKLKIGDDVLEFNSKPFCDMLDYIYYDGEDVCTLKVKKTDGRILELTFRKNDDFDSLGLEFDSSVSIDTKVCRNNCIFCFVNQLPQGMRKTLYVKDDDFRLSFLEGCYITCTNLSDSDVERIIRLKLSPLYISVHATDSEVRKFMLGVKNVPEQMPLIRKLCASGIILHSQIVLCGGINDGEILTRSLSDLYNAGVKTVAVVPVGLTKHREGLYPLVPLTREQASEAVDTVEKFYSKHNYFCYCSDEMYERAGREVHGNEYYGDYEQLQNGVGLQTLFLSEIKEELEFAEKKCRRKIAVITGVSGESTMLKAKGILESFWKGFTMNVYPVKNKFFGESITVSGLITASDILDAFKGHTFTEEEILIPSVMLALPEGSDEEMFLDNISLTEAGKRLGKKLTPVNVTGGEFVNAIIGGGKGI